MNGIGTMMAGGKPVRRERSAADFYPTPPAASWAFLQAAGPVIRSVSGGHVWEPACGDGALSEALRAYGLEVTATDLHTYGYAGQSETVDFLRTSRTRAPIIVTNPPFSLAAKFIEHALGRLKLRGLGLLLKATFWHAGRPRRPVASLSAARDLSAGVARGLHRREGQHHGPVVVLVGPGSARTLRGAPA